jgi:hypothetical protein
VGSYKDNTPPSKANRSSAAGYPKELARKRFLPEPYPQELAHKRFLAEPYPQELARKRFLAELHL